MERGIENADYYYLLNRLKDAVADFNRIEIDDQPVPKVGIVGEIFVKYNFFTDGNIVDWLSGQGVEVVLPPYRVSLPSVLSTKPTTNRRFSSVP